MDFVFPVFVRASNDATPPAPPQKSLWQLVMESGPNDALPERVAPRRMAAKRAENDDGLTDAHNSWRGGENDAAASHAAGATTAANDGVTSRSSWTPVMYMTEHLMSSGFASQYAMFHGIECSARLPPPPCLRLEDLQLPPIVLTRLRRQLQSPRGAEGSASAAAQNLRRPDLLELQAIVFGSASATASCGDNNAGEGAGGDAGGCCDEYVPEELFLTALQQFTVTSMLLGHHTFSVGPKGLGKKTIGLLATGALTLAREACKPIADTESGSNGDANLKNTARRQEFVGAPMMRPPAPQAMILVSSFREVHQCNEWLQSVFTASAFAPMTFRRDTVELVPLPVMHEDPCHDASTFHHATLQEAFMAPLLPQPAFPPKEESPPSHRPRDRHKEDRTAHKRGRDHSRSRRDRSRSLDAHERTRRRRHRSTSRRRSRTRRRSRSRSRGRRFHRRDRRERSGSLGGKGRHRSRSGGSHERRKRRRRGEDSRSRQRHRHHAHSDHQTHSHHREEPREALADRPFSEREWTEGPHNIPDTRAAVSPAAIYNASVADVFSEEIPSCLQRRIPILIATQQSLVEALQIVQGQAEVLPLECVRIVCISDADRMAQPSSQSSVPTSWWISLSNAVDVDCQYIVSTSRMYDEVDGWMRETLLRETPDVVHRYRQRDDTVWCGVHHFADVVVVEEAEERAAQQTFERVEAAKMRRLLAIVARHFQPLHTPSEHYPTVAHNHDGNNHNNNHTNDATVLAALVGRLVVVVASRKEQDSVFQQLSSGLQECAACVRCTCHLPEFQRGEADVLVTCDWMLCLSSDAKGDVSGRPVRTVINFGFPRALMAPGKEEGLLECLVIRARTLLHHTATMEGDVREDATRGDGGGDVFSPANQNAAKLQPTVVTLLTERQMYGRIGKLLTSCAQAVTSQ